MFLEKIMKQLLGIVKRVYLPNEYINGEPVLDLYKTKIGFEVTINGKVIKFEQEQNKENVKIYVGDKVTLIFDLAKSKYPINIKAVK